MVYRYSWIAGLGVIGFSLWELNHLLRSSTASTPWQVIVIAGLALGMIITWTAVSYRLDTWLIAVLNLAALFLASARFTAPESTLVILPTGTSIDVLWSELSRAWELIQNGVEPVVPLPGLVVIITTVFWGLGALLVWGLAKGHPFVALVPPLVVALQFATVDRNESGLMRVGFFILLVAGAIVAVNADERDAGAGRMVRPGEWPSRSSGLPSPTATGVVGLVVVASIFAVGLLDPMVPRDGVVRWRNSSGLTGDYFGSISYNPFVEIRASVLSQTDTPVFTATVAGDIPATEVYFRMLTLESFSGGQWFADSPVVSRTTEVPWEVAGNAYVGPTETVDAAIEILALRMDWLPAPYAAFAVAADDPSVDGALRVRNSDASLRYDGGRSYEGMTYSVRSAIPRFDSDALASLTSGTLSPLFATAAGAEENIPEPRTDLVERELEDRARYVELPEDLDPRIAGEARAVTRNLTTAFEQGLALEKWFRESGGFVYDASVATGHASSDLAEWLFGENNPDRRHGYCEQFAAGMAVMARALDIPSRVVLGFTPGERIGNDQVVVRDHNAHAWVELWIPTQGWISFDPTPRSDGANPGSAYQTLAESLGYDVTEYLPEVPAPDGSFTNGLPGLPPQLALDDPRGDLLPGGETVGLGGGLPDWIVVVLPLAGVVLALLAALPVVKWVRSRRRMRRLEHGDISAAWQEIVTRLTDLGDAPDPAKTPIEVAAGVDPAMRPLAGVYGRSIYGVGGSVTAADVATATDSLERTANGLTTRYPRSTRLVAWYRIGSLLPSSGPLRRRRRRR